MTETKAVRVLPADVFDALELSAEAFGGIGAFNFWRPGDTSCPHCIVGHAYFLDGGPKGPVRNALLDAFSPRGLTSVNDAAVRRLSPDGQPIFFADWCAELGVVRGAQ